MLDSRSGAGGGDYGGGDEPEYVSPGRIECCRGGQGGGIGDDLDDEIPF